MLRRSLKIKILLKSSILFLLVIASVNCGVKGDPLPPEKPPILGRGQPSFNRAAEEIELPELPPVMLNDEDEDELESDKDD